MHTFCLGITIDEHLDGKGHIDYLSNKIARNVGMLNKLKHFLPVYIMKTLYSSLIASHLQYCTLLWENSHVTNIRKLQLLQNKSIRIISGINDIISLHCTHRSTILYNNTFKMRRPVQIPIKHIRLSKHNVTHFHKICHQCSYELIILHRHQLRNQHAYYIQQIRTNTRKSTINFSGPTF